MQVNSFPAGTYERFSGVTLEKVLAQPAFLAVIPGKTREFPVCKSPGLE
jgi:hypothetical protein